MEVIQVFDRPAPQDFYSVAGRLLFIESLDLELRNLILHLFAGWQLTSVALPDRSPDIRIRFFCGAGPKVPGNLNQFEIAEGGRCYTDGMGFYLALRNSLIRLESGNPLTVSVWLTEMEGPGDPVLARTVSFAVCAALRRFGLFDLHSAGVVHPDSEKGVLIIGRSGSGKSTLALQLVAAGWPYLSDDELLLSFADGAVEARGFRSFFAVSAGQKTAGFKTCFEPDTVFGSQRRLQASPGVLLFSRVSGEPATQLTKLTEAEAMMRLIRACPWATYDTAVAGANLEVLSALARQTSAFDLFAGLDLLEPGSAAKMLSNIE
jgi:hypothetical protein